MLGILRLALLPKYHNNQIVSSLILTTKSADACKRILYSGKSPPELKAFSGVTLPGLVELGLGVMHELDADGVHGQIRELARQGCPIWGPFVHEWNSPKRTGHGSDPHGSRSLEFFRLRTKEDLLDENRFQLFQERLVRSIKGNGFDDGYSYALAKTLHEMADNIIQHSHTVGVDATGIVGYHTEAHYMAITVADLGRGMLNSLRTNPDWAHLSTSQQAVTAIVQEGASSRNGQGQGEGFRQLFRSLIDRNSVVRLRTNDAALTMSDVNDKRLGVTQTVPITPGAQVSICCCLRGIAEEKRIFACHNN